MNKIIALQLKKCDLCRRIGMEGGTSWVKVDEEDLIRIGKENIGSVRTCADCRPKLNKYQWR